MSVEELIQLMRTCSLAKVRKTLKIIKKGAPDAYVVLVGFYQLAAKQKE